MLVVDTLASTFFFALDMKRIRRYFDALLMDAIPDQCNEIRGWLHPSYFASGTPVGEQTTANGLQVTVYPAGHSRPKQEMSDYDNPSSIHFFGSLALPVRTEGP